MPLDIVEKGFPDSYIFEAAVKKYSPDKVAERFSLVLEFTDEAVITVERMKDWDNVLLYMAGVSYSALENFPFLTTILNETSENEMFKVSNLKIERKK